MNYRVATTGLLCLFTACSVPHGAATGTTTTPVERSDEPASRPTASWRTPSPQYSPREMFMNKHGDFMLRHELWRPDFLVTASAMSDSEVKNEPGDFNLIHGRFSANGRVAVDDDRFLNLGADYGRRDYDHKSATPNGANDEVLTRASLTLGYGQFLDDNTLVEVNFEPGVYSDFSGTLHTEDWQMYSNALLTWQFDRNIFLKAGAEHSGLFRDLDAFPLAGLTWLIDPTFRLDLLLPKQARITADLTDSTSLNASLDLVGGKYEIRVAGNNAQRTVNVQELELSLGGHHRIGKSLSFHARVGTTLMGDYRWRDNTANVYDGSLEPQLFAELGFGLDF